MGERLPGSSAPPQWHAVALDPPRAHGEPLGCGVLRSRLEDFMVDEDLGFEPDGDGSHLLLRVRKRGANTEWTAGVIARAAGARVADVGFAGLKDRHAVTTQWFSVPARPANDGWWRSFSHEEIEILEAHPHRRKLKRGALRGNRFRLRIRDAAVDPSALDARVQAIRGLGVPNYFGTQRFGRDASNIHAAWLWAKRASEGQGALRDRSTRGFVLSAARSLLFNAVLAERVRDGSWSQLRIGDVANLDGTGSIFEVSELTDDLVQRLARLDIHPTGPMWGAGELRSAGATRAVEEAVGTRFDPLPQVLARAGLEQERRSLRLPVKDLQTTIDNDIIELSFDLPAGAFATVVVRELIVRSEGDA
jgi:tRNA pseudouridine13 synthase